MTKAPKSDTLSLSEGEQTERVRAVVDRLLGRSPNNALTYGLPALETSRPNIHDNKAEFQAELERVECALAGLRDAQEQLIGTAAEDDRKQQAIATQFRSAIDRSARRRVATLQPETAVDLIRRSNALVGFFLASQSCLMDLISALEERREELNDQGKEFWRVSNRPPHYFARAIALRLARLYAREKGKEPTSGKARDGGHPSTEFVRALEEVFSIIGVRADVRRAAKWAIEQLTEDDLRPPPMGSVLAVMPARRPRSILGALAKPREK